MPPSTGSNRNEVPRTGPRISGKKADDVKMILKDVEVSHICCMKFKGISLVGQVLDPELVVLFNGLIGQR